MKAFSRVVAERDNLGGTRLTVLHSESPLLLRRTGPTTVHLVGGGAGPLRGDDLRLDIAVGPGATLEIRSVAAQLALPGRDHLPPSRFEITATVAAGATLRWHPEPMIAAAGCDHHTITRVDVAEGGTLLWRDDLVCGRHHEDSGNVRLDTTIRYAGTTLYRHDLAVGPAAPGWSGPAILGGGRAIGTIVFAPDTMPATSGPGDYALMPLAGPGMLATAIADDIRPVQAALDPLCEPTRALAHT
ncbi:urease accessory protein UreD [Actinoplanes bogorensis]|uniref:Urease accessory protein UreD n=1 Tax=Paractinoplanes bogorensis TaxID=1610840 RepID=A0ABS5YVG9_9ACTN|nr:urease accessory protein UreD [Actinoplanes bogorensis]MBU2666694.1 urease accessory protein UreD [Actinoplanes bogorensis]